MNIKKVLTEKIIRATEKEMHTKSPKCPMVYYQPIRPTKPFMDNEKASRTK